MADVKDPYGVLTADDFTNFQVQRQRVNDTFNLGVAQNQYQRDSLQQQYDQGLAGLKRRYAQGFRSLSSPWSRRGLLNSGLYQRGIKDYEDSYNQQLRDAAETFNQSLAGIDLSNQQLKSVKDASISEIDLRDAARRATAYSLKMGGIGV